MNGRAVQTLPNYLAADLRPQVNRPADVPHEVLIHLRPSAHARIQGIGGHFASRVGKPGGQSMLDNSANPLCHKKPA